MGIVPLPRVLAPRRAVTAALTLGALVGVAGCGATAMNSAGRSDSIVISEDDLATVVEQTGEAGLDLTASDALGHLLREPVLAQIAVDQGLGLSDENLRQQFVTAGLADPSDQTIDALRGYIIYNQVVQADPATLSPQDAELVGTIQAEYAERIAQEDVEVNPRFGDWDAATGVLSAEQPAWITESDEPEIAGDPLLPSDDQAPPSDQ